MSDASNPRARLRLILISVIFATIPCYCLGGIAVMLAPDSAATVTPTWTPVFTATLPLQILTATSSPNPAVITATPSNTPTVTPSATNTPTSTLTSSPTFTLTVFLPPSDTPTNTPTYTPSSTFTVTASFTPITPTNTQTPSITPFPTTASQ